MLQPNRSARAVRSSSQTVAKGQESQLQPLLAGQLLGTGGARVGVGGGSGVRVAILGCRTCVVTGGSTGAGAGGARCALAEIWDLADPVDLAAAQAFAAARVLEAPAPEV